MEPNGHRVAQERDAGIGAEGYVLQAEHTNGEVRQREVEARGDTLRGDVHMRRVRKAVERDEFAQPVHEGERTEEPNAAKHHVDLRLAAGTGVEADAPEHQLHQPCGTVTDEVQVKAGDLRDDVNGRRRTGRGADFHVKVQGVLVRGCEDVRHTR